MRFAILVKHRGFVATCNAGKVKVQPLSPTPSDLLELFDEHEFRNNIRNYNNAMAFTSLGKFI